MKSFVCSGELQLSVAQTDETSKHYGQSPLSGGALPNVPQLRKEIIEAIG